MILAIDTATPALSAAVVLNGSALAQATVRRRNAHDELLATLLEQVISWSGITPSDISAVAVSAGPGSFTGLRIGMAAAKGFATALGIPLLRVPTLEAIALRVLKAGEARKDALIAALLVSRGDELYAALYMPSGDAITEVRPGFAVSDVTLAGLLPPGAVIAGDGAERIELLFPGRYQRAMVSDTPADALTIGRIAEGLLDAGSVDDAASCEPYYVQSFHPTRPKSPAK